MRHLIDEDKHTLIFDNWYEFITAAENDSEMIYEDRSSRRSYTPRQGTVRTPLAPYFHGAFATWSEALKTARTGWTAGAQEIERVFEDIRPQSKEVRLTIEPDRVGPGTWSKGRLIAGHPKPWLKWHETEIITDNNTANGGVIPLGINISQSAGVDAATRFKIGAAVLALIDILERAGKRVELTLFNAVQGYGNGAAINIAVTVKRADDPLNMANLAYAFANAATQRRLCWSVRETMEEEIRVKCNVTGMGNYGCTDPEWQVGDSSFIEGAGGSNLSDKNQVHKWIKDQAAKWNVYID